MCKSRLRNHFLTMRTWLYIRAMPIKDPEARRKYHAAYMRKYLEDPAHRREHIARAAKSNARHTKLLRLVIDDFRSQGCKFCSEKENCCMSAHHIDPDQKDFTIGSAIAQHIPVAKLEMELLKCICVCENCHRKIHAGLISIEGV